MAELSRHFMKHVGLAAWQKHSASSEALSDICAATAFVQAWDEAGDAAMARSGADLLALQVNFPDDKLLGLWWYKGDTFPGSSGY